MTELVDKLKGGLLGQAVGDALGVPVEFQSRNELKANPVTDMIGWGTHSQPPGTWSDDSSLMFCTMAALVEDKGLEGVAEKFVQWYQQGYWTPRGEVFDIGTTTITALRNLDKGIPFTESGVKTEYSQSNGSLMRILPASLYYLLKNDNRLDWKSVLEPIHAASAITHAHPTCLVACGIHGIFIHHLLNGKSPLDAYHATITDAQTLYSKQEAFENILKLFDRILSGNLPLLAETDISSSGYVVHTLEAAMWSFLTTASFEDAVLVAVNLGDDTDTVGAITGGLAGLYHGINSIPPRWIDVLAKKDEIFQLCDSFIQKMLRKE